MNPKYIRSIGLFALAVIATSVTSLIPVAQAQENLTLLKKYDLGNRKTSEGIDFYDSFLWHTTSDSLYKLDPDNSTDIDGDGDYDLSADLTWIFTHSDFSESSVWLDDELYNFTFLDSESHLSDDIYKLFLNADETYTWQHTGDGQGATNWGSCRDKRSPGESIIYTGHWDNRLMWYDPETGDTTRTLVIPGLDEIEDLGMDRYGRVWASSYSSINYPGLYCIDPDTGDILDIFDGPIGLDIIDGIAIRSVGNHDVMYVTGKQAQYIWEYRVPRPIIPLLVAGPGPADDNPPLVRVIPPEQDAGYLDEFAAYGATRYGVNVTCGSLSGDSTDAIITGAGPGSIYGPHVRAFQADGTPLAGVNFLAYGTNRWGVNVAAGDIDGDGYDEIITGAGPGAVFGPHVRGWNYDGDSLAPNSDVSFFAYSTDKYGVVVSCGDIDGDGIDEMVTGPGPGGVFGAHVRGWNYDGGSVTAMTGCSFFAWSPDDVHYGAKVFAGADLDGDGRSELLVGCGLDPAADTTIKVFGYNDGETVQLFSLEAFPGLSKGVNPAAGLFRQSASRCPAPSRRPSGSRAAANW